MTDKKAAKKSAQEARKKARLAEVASGKVLMILMPDGRQFFTFEDSFASLVEFSRSVGAEVSLVKIDPEGIPIQELPELAQSFGGQTTPVTYELIETRIPKGEPMMKPPQPHDDRAERIKKAKKVDDYIRSELLAGRTVSLLAVEDKFTMSKSMVYNHFQMVRSEIEKTGRNVESLGLTQYKIAEPSHYQMKELFKRTQPRKMTY